MEINKNNTSNSVISKQKARIICTPDELSTSKVMHQDRQGKLESNHNDLDIYTSLKYDILTRLCA